MKPRKRYYYIEFNEKKNQFEKREKDPLYTKKAMWDFNFELRNYAVKKETLNYYAKIFDLTSKNRDIISELFYLFIVNVENMNETVDSKLVDYLHGLFIRAIKTSRVVQDLSFQGNYVEAQTLLRTNFEKAVFIQYFIKHDGELRYYLEARKANNKRVLKKYTIKNLTNDIKKDYYEYQYLCQFVHAYSHEDDLQFTKINGKFYGSLVLHNKFDYVKFMWINYINNNILVETFLSIFKYFIQEIPKENLEHPKLNKLLRKINKIRTIELEPPKKL